MKNGQREDRRLALPPRSPRGLLAAVGTELGISSEPGRWCSPARDTLPRAGGLGVAGIITDSCQLRAEVCGHSKAWKCAGRKSRPPPSLAQLAQGLPSRLSSPFVLRFVLPSLPHQHPSNKNVLIEDSSVLEATRKRLVECDLASPLSGLPCFVCACNGFCSKGQRSWTWIWCVPGVFFLFPFLGRG